MKYSISNWIYADEPLRTTSQRLRKYGYDGVELVGEPQRYDVEEVKALCEEFNLEVLFSGLLMKALKEINYQWALAMEPLPPFPNPFIGIRMEKYLPLRDVYAEECITRLRQYEREV